MAMTSAQMEAAIKKLQADVVAANKQALVATSAAERAQNTANDANTTATSISSVIAAVPATPDNPSSQEYNPENINKNIKIATSNLLVDQSPPTVDRVANLLFQEFAASELITNTPNFSLFQYNGGQNNTINNIKEIVKYSFSTNIPQVPADVSSSISKYIPTVGNGTNGSTVYFDTSNQYIYIEFININTGEFVEYQVVSQATALDATI